MQSQLSYRIAWEKKITAEALKPTDFIAFRRIPSPFPAPGVNL